MWNTEPETFAEPESGGKRKAPANQARGGGAKNIAMRRNNSLQNVPYMYSYDPWYEDACNLPKLCEGMAHIGAVIASSIITRYRVFWNGWSEIARHVINHQMC